jgi:ATP synthase protein I
MRYRLPSTFKWPLGKANLVYAGFCLSIDAVKRLLAVIVLCWQASGVQDQMRLHGWLLFFLNLLTMNNRYQLKNKIESQIKRLKKAEHDRPNLLSQTIYIGTLGLVMVLPIIGGAYLGHWLDGMMAGYSIRWTLSLLLAGVMIGIFNVYFLVKEKP